MRTFSLLSVLTLSVCLATSDHAVGQVLLSDSFSRTAGTPAVLDDIPPMFGESDWGMNDNAAGGAEVASYLTLTSMDEMGMSNEQFPEIVDGEQAILGFGAAVLDFNMAANASILSAGAVKISIDVNPTDSGGGSLNGRDWAGIVVGDTNGFVERDSEGAPISGAIGGSGFLFNTNTEDSRVGLAPRNSGTLLTRRGANFQGDGKPDPDVKETVFDAAVFGDTDQDGLVNGVRSTDGYIGWYDGGDGTAPGDPVQEFVNDNFYTIELIIRKGAGTNEIFDAGAPHTMEISVVRQGEAPVRLDPNPLTPEIEEDFDWGDNNPNTASGAADPDPNDKLAYLVFVGNAGGHRFDNLLIEALSGAEPAAGDFNGDGRVDNGDLNLLLGNWGSATVPPEWVNGFATPVDNGELNALLGNWGFGVSVAVPEPTSLVLCGLLVAVAAPCRRPLRTDLSPAAAGDAHPWIRLPLLSSQPGASY